MQGNVHVSFPALEREIAAEGVRAVASLHLTYEEGRPAGPQRKGSLAGLGHDLYPTDEAAIGDQYGRGLQASGGAGLERHQS